MATRWPRTDVESWLIGQACDQLADGAVGLYEMIWWLETSRFRIAPTSARGLARRIVAQLVDCRLAELLRLAWPSYRIVAGPLSAEILDDEYAWRAGDEFIALVCVMADPPT